MILEFDLNDSYYHSDMTDSEKMEVERVSAMQNEEYFKTVFPSDTYFEEVTVVIIPDESVENIANTENADTGGDG
jgi:hypothetical protein